MVEQSACQLPRTWERVGKEDFIYGAKASFPSLYELWFVGDRPGKPENDPKPMITVYRSERPSVSPNLTEFTVELSDGDDHAPLARVDNEEAAILLADSFTSKLQTYKSVMERLGE